jgi:hypothetical protein
MHASLTHRKKIQILNRSSSELTRVNVSLVDAMMDNSWASLGSRVPCGNLWI